MTYNPEERRWVPKLIPVYRKVLIDNNKYSPLYHKRGVIDDNHNEQSSANSM